MTQVVEWILQQMQMYIYMENWLIWSSHVDSCPLNELKWNVTSIFTEITVLLIKEFLWDWQETRCVISALHKANWFPCYWFDYL